MLDGTRLSTAVHDQFYPTVASDGAGGAIVTWHDFRNGTDYDIYAQRVNAAGTVQWTPDGVALCTAAGAQAYPTIASDGTGGAIVTWHDSRSGVADIYTQRVNASGVSQWTPNGVALCIETDIQYLPTVVADGIGGGIVIWQDFRSGTDFDIYTQRVDVSGVPQWTADGVAVCIAVDNQYEARIASDGAGGVVVTWQDSRSGVLDIYAHRVNAAGMPQWTADGVALCTAVTNQCYPKIATDGAGGAIVTWFDHRNGDADIYAQRADASGTPQWTANGVALCNAAEDQFDPTVATDGAGGAIVTWFDHRSGNADIYAQRVDAAGTPQWTADGIALCTAAGYQEVPKVVADGMGGAIVVWHDPRNGDADIYAQRVNASGAPQWTPNGVALCAAADDQIVPRIISDDAEGAIVTWEDYRSGTDYDIYALGIGPGGSIPTGVRGTPSSLVLTPNYPNPFSTGTTIDLSLSTDAMVEIDVFDVTGRRVRTIDLGRVRAGSRQMSFDGLGDDGGLLPSGVYFYRVSAKGETLTRKLVIAR
jgi:hypothetical protein